MKSPQPNGSCAALLEQVSQAHTLYYRLVLVVGPLSLELSRRLLDLTERQRALAVRELLAGIVEEAAGQAAPGKSSTFMRLPGIQSTVAAVIPKV